MSEPETELLRYGEVREWLLAEGIKEAEFRKLIATRVIRPRPIREGGRNYYRRSQIRAVLNSEEKIGG